LKEDLKSWDKKQLKQGESFVIVKMSEFGAEIDHPTFGRDAITQKDFGRLEVSVVVAWPSVPRQ